MQDQRNLILAVALAAAIFIGFQYFFPPPKPPVKPVAQTTEAQTTGATTPAVDGVPQPAPSAVSPTSDPVMPVQALAQREDVLAAGKRVRIDSPRVHGSVNLVGGRFDDVTLVDYRVTTDRNSPEIVLLSPVGTAEPYFADFGWTVTGPGVKVPGPDTVWTADKDVLRADEPLTLSWDNGEGLRFERVISLDKNYMFTVVDRVTNSGQAALTLFPYARIQRMGDMKVADQFILHEGLVGVLDGTLKEHKYKDIKEETHLKETSTGGWIGFTDKYWLTAIVPPQDVAFTASFNHATAGGADRYQVDYLKPAVEVAPGATAETTGRLFAGAKEVHLLDNYAADLGIAKFDLAIDFGWFYFLTKPIFLVIDFFNKLLGNFGLAILLLTVIIKGIFFPLANKSYESMSKMKKLTPKMTEIRERWKDDRARQQQEMMELYKREKVNPLAGCLPILVQIPVFFALYKVLFVSIEMRHAPFFGWIQDLAAPDPTHILNLFGLIPWTPPGFLGIGVWPIIMGITMYLQQRLNPPPPDPVQARVFQFMPVIFTFMLAQFPAGLVIYWTWNNLLSIAQQWLIMRRMGVKI
jgi:YidC/Oxa1 family membrane protein insertase